MLSHAPTALPISCARRAQCQRRRPLPLARVPHGRHVHPHLEPAHLRADLRPFSLALHTQAMRGGSGCDYPSATRRRLLRSSTCLPASRANRACCSNACCSATGCVGEKAWRGFVLCVCDVVPRHVGFTTSNRLRDPLRSLTLIDAWQSGQPSSASHRMSRMSHARPQVLWAQHYDRPSLLAMVR